MSDQNLSQMVESAPDQVSKLESSSSKIDDQITDLQNKQNSIQTSVCTKAATNLQTYLIGTKFTPEENYNFYKGPNFDQSTEETGNFTDWKVYEKIEIDVYYFSSSEFKCTGDQTSIFTNNLDISLLLNSGRVYTLVNSSSFDSDLNETTVSISGSIDSTLSQVSKFYYSYISGDDTTVDDYKTSWDFGHDYIIQPLGTAGTYGTKDMLAKLNSAKTMIQTTKQKINNSISIFSKFL